MNIRTGLLFLALILSSNVAYAVIPPVCAEAYRRSGAVPGKSDCQFVAAANAGLDSYTCTASGSDTFIPEYCANMPEDNCSGASNQKTTFLGNPINIATGHKLQQVVDYVDHDWSQVNLPLELKRFYNSNTAIPPGIFGMAWRSNFDRTLLISSTTVTVVRPVGGMKRFELQNGSWTPNRYVADRLVELTDGAGNRTGWRYITESMTTEEYDAAGALISMANRHGRKLVITYQNGNLHRVTDQTGRFLTFSFNSNGSVASMTDPAGQIYSYTYDVLPFSNGTRSRLKSVSYPDRTPDISEDNPTSTYLYGEDAYVQQASDDQLAYFAYHLTGIVDENGNRYASYGYDHAGRAIMTVHGTHNEDGTAEPKDNANRMDVVYNVTYGLQSTNWQAQSFNAQGKQTNYSFHLAGTLRRASTVTGVASPNCAASSSSYSYDANGFSDKVTDWNGNVTDYTINSAGLETSRIEAQGKPEQRVIGTDWYADLRQPQEIREEGRTVRFTYENEHIKSRTVIDTTTHTVPYSTNGRTRQWSYTYTYHDTAQTQIASVSINGPRTDVSDIHIYRYNPQGWMTESTNALGHRTRILEHTPRGQPVRIEDANGVVTRLDYHPRGWLERRTHQSAAGNLVTEYVYDEAGLLKTMTAPNGVTLNYGYDTAHRLRTITNNGGETLTLALDEFGNPIAREVRDASNGIQQLVQQDFDELGRLWKTIAPEGHSDEVYAYDNNSNPIRIENAVGTPRVQAFDGLNRLSQIVDRENGNVVYEYDARNNLTKVTDQNNLETLYTVDGFGFTIQETSPDRGVIVKRYDPAGNMIEERSGRNVVTTYTYDALNRVKTLAVAGFASDGETYFHDETTTESIANRGIGKLTRISQNAGDTQAFIYDDRGNVTQVLNKIGTVTQTVRYGYSPGNDLTSITYPSGRIVDYALDNLARIRSITTRDNAAANPQVVVQDAIYKPFGPLRHLQYGNNMTLDKAYDRHYRIEGIDAVGGAPVMRLNYGYDTRGNIDSISDILATGSSQTLGYDELSRLTSALGDYGRFEFDYDPVGNRNLVNWNQGGASFVETYATQPSISNRLQSVQRSGTGASSRDYAYSDSGNMTGDGSRTFEYDGRDRLIGVRQGAAVIATYDHNALGQRIRKTISTDAAASRLFHYDLSGRLLAETRPNGEPLIDYIYLNDMPLAMIDVADEPTTLQPDLVVTLAGRNGKAIKQDDDTYLITYAIKIRNKGEADAAGVTLSNSFPAGTTLASYTASQGDCAPDGLSCALGTLSAGQTATLTLVTREDNDTKEPYTATAATTSTESITENNSATVQFGGSLGLLLLGMLTLLYGLRRWGRFNLRLRKARPVLLGTVFYSVLTAPGSSLASTLYYIHNDHLNTPKVMTDQNQQVVWKGDYEPFGTVSEPVKQVENNLRFPGQYHDRETGLHYNYFRDYDPGIGRYVQADPIGLSGGLNTYGYVKESPFTYIDPYGLDVRRENTTSVYGLHQRISVDGKGGSIYGQSFGRTGSENDGSTAATGAGQPTPGKEGQGMVYQDTVDPATKVQETLKTSPDQDEKIQEWLREDLGNTGPYSPIWNNCRDYSSDKFDQVQEKLKNGDFGS